MTKFNYRETEFLRNAGGGGGGAVVVVVEYMQSVMSKQLLCKFPDNSAYDFDYTQSNIWSPLIQRHRNIVQEDLDMEMLAKSLSSSSSFYPTRKKLDYNEEEADFDKMLDEDESGRRVTCATAATTSIKKLTADFKFYLHSKKMKINKNGFGFSPPAAAAANSPNQRKGWGKMLKAAASGHFKRKSKKKDNCKLKQKQKQQPSYKYLGYLND